MKRFLVVTALGVAALAAGAAPAGATNECRGLQICVPVAGPWVVVEAANTVPRPRVEYQLSCPRGYIVGGLDAELSDPAIDLGFLATLGSPVNPGVSTSRAAVFFATYAGASARLSTFRPHIGCIPASGGGQRTPTVARAVPPGRPTSRRVRTMLLSLGPRATRDRVLPCGRAARLRLARGRLLHEDASDRRPGLERVHDPDRAGEHGHRCNPIGNGDRPSTGGDPGRRSLRGWTMSFGQPLFLLTLLVLPLAVGASLLVRRRRMRYAIRFTNLDVLAAVAHRRSWRRYIAPLVFLLSLAALCVGMARPHVTSLVPQNEATVILVVDVSGSMQATDVKPTRLRAAEQAVSTFLDHAPKGLRIGLIAFAREPGVAAPPTTDHDLVRQSLGTLDYFQSYGGTAIGDALAAAVELARSAVGETAPASPSTGKTIAFRPKGPQSPVSILFLSDGAQTRGILQPLEGAARAKAAGIPVYTVALGTPNGTLTFNGPQFGGGPFQRGYGGRTIPVPPDPTTLRAIAETTGGRFFEARSAKAVESAYATLGARLGRKPGKREVTNDFVLAAAGLLIAAGLLSAFWSPRLP